MRSPADECSFKENQMISDGGNQNIGREKNVCRKTVTTFDKITSMILLGKPGSGKQWGY